MSLLHRTRADDDVIDRDHVRRDTVTDTDTAITPSRTKERSWTFAPGQLVSLAVGVGFIAVGVIAMLRAGIDGSFDTPVVDVLRFSHTAWLGLAEVGLGFLLVLAGTGAWGRPLSVLLGAAMLVGGVLVLAEPGQMPDELGLEKDYGWPLVGFGALVALAAMVLPVWRSHRIDHVELDRRDEHAEPAHHAELR